MIDNIVLLGASGSIGTQALDIISEEQDKFRLVGFSVGKNINKVYEIVKQFPNVKYVCIQDPNELDTLKNRFPNITFFSSDEGLIKVIDAAKPTLVVNALVGFVGLAPTVHALELGIDVALANKEAIVVGGELIKSIQEKTNAKIYPIDSEHVAISKILGSDPNLVKEVIITASGGPFLGRTREELQNVTRDEALNHPTWKMGPKITIDSATLMNKGFEIIEASYLFDLPLEKISFIIHPQSKVHAIVRFVDESLLFEVGPTDMHIPISYALHKCNRHKTNAEDVNLAELSNLTFINADKEDYPLINLAYDALSKKGFYPAILNAANEVAVHAFLEEKITFLEIIDVVTYIYKRDYDFLNHNDINLQRLVEVNEEIQKLTKKHIEGIAK